MSFKLHLFIASVSTFMSGACLADFSGPYAPENWTFKPGVGGVLVEHSATTLIFHNGDDGFGHDTEITLVAAATGIWTFDWVMAAQCCDTGYPETAYYLINGDLFYLATPTFGAPIKSGSVSTTVSAGDVIGFRIESLDGIFGYGTMTVTDFSAPVPAPAAGLAILGAIRLCVRRRRGFG